MSEIKKANKIEEMEHTVNTVKGVVESLVPAVDKVLKKIDKNDDGKVTFDEFVTWGGELLNGEGFKMLLFTIGSIVFMVLSDLIIGYFDLVAQDSIWGVIGKLIAVAILTYGWKTVTANMDKEKKKLVKVINEKVKIIKEKDEIIHAQNIAIEILKFQQKD